MRLLPPVAGHAIQEQTASARSGMNRALTYTGQLRTRALSRLELLG